MYNRKRIARGAGAALAVWGLIGLLIMSTGVAYAVPLAGLGGFNIAAEEISADNMLLYPGVGDTSTMEYYPQTIVELRDVRLDGLWLYKTFDLSKTPGLSGQARVFLWTGGETNADSVLVKSSALATDGDATFRDFAVTEQSASDPRGQFQMTADSGVTLERPRINAHYLASSKLSVSNTKLMMCYDPDDDDVYEVGGCPDGDPISRSYELGRQPPTDAPQPEISNDPSLGEVVSDIGDDIADTVEDVGQAIEDGAETIGGVAEVVGDAVGDAADAVGDAVETVGDAVGDAVDAVGDAVDTVTTGITDAIGSIF